MNKNEAAMIIEKGTHQHHNDEIDRILLEVKDDDVRLQSPLLVTGQYPGTGKSGLALHLA